ncbi:hypothetical protein GCM10010501_00750 [Streptomyces libani subsp. rufus]|nr:hypothetical protein GCM10010501_00750 [Streptomyces libani subsp. rufus]
MVLRCYGLGSVRGRRARGAAAGGGRFPRCRSGFLAQPELYEAAPAVRRAETELFAMFTAADVPVA